MKSNNRTIWSVIPITVGAVACTIAALAAPAPVVQLPPDAEPAAIHTPEAGPAVSLPDQHFVASAAPSGIRSNRRAARRKAAAAEAAPSVAAAPAVTAAAPPVAAAAPRIATAPPRVMMPTLTDPAVHTAEAGPVVSLPQK